MAELFSRPGAKRASSSTVGTIAPNDPPVSPVRPPDQSQPAAPQSFSLPTSGPKVADGYANVNLPTSPYEQPKESANKKGMPSDEELAKRGLGYNYNDAFRPEIPKKTGPMKAPPETASGGLGEKIPWKAYGGSGEKGTGFENWERFASANKESIQNWLDVKTKAAREAQTAAESAIGGASESWQSTLAEDEGPDQTTDKKGPKAIGKAPIPETQIGNRPVGGMDAVLNPGQPTSGSLASPNIPPKEAPSAAEPPQKDVSWYNSQIDTKKNELARLEGYAGKDSEEAKKMRAELAGLEAERLEHINSLIAAHDFYSTEASRKMDETAEEVAKRTQAMSGFEGTLGQGIKEGRTLGESAFDAALNTSGSDYERALNQITGQNEVLGARYNKAQDDAVKLQQEKLAKNASEINRLRGESTYVPPAKEAQSKRSKSWNEYWGGWGKTGQDISSLFINPQRLLNTYGRDAGIEGFVDLLNQDTTKNRGVGEEGNAENIFGGLGYRGGQAMFKDTEEDVYNSMTDQELRELEAMEPKEQRDWIEARKKQIGGTK